MGPQGTKPTIFSPYLPFFDSLWLKFEFLRYFYKSLMGHTNSKSRSDRLSICKIYTSYSKWLEARREFITCLRGHCGENDDDIEVPIYMDRVDATKCDMPYCARCTR